jgi:dTDP-4-dehydrorhamnose 3,5-epimerase
LSARFLQIAEPIPGLRLLERRRLQDDRGHFERLFCAGELGALGYARPPRQINTTLTRVTGTVRGLHLQRPPHAETKLVSCLTGRVFDVAVDLRAGSPTYGQWYGAELSERNSRTLLIPPGFAHGFQTLEPDTRLIYAHDADYVPEAEDGISISDPDLAIDWPLPIRTLSDRDKGLKPFADFSGVEA